MQASEIPLNQLFPMEANQHANLNGLRAQVLFGNSQNNSPGLLNHPEIPRIFAPKVSDISDASLVWHHNISHALQTMANLSAETETPDSILLPHKTNFVYQTSLLLKANNIKNVNVLPELSGMSNGNAMLLYANHSDNFKIFVNQLRGEVKVVVYRPYSLLLVEAS